MRTKACVCAVVPGVDDLAFGSDQRFVWSSVCVCVCGVAFFSPPDLFHLGLKMLLFPPPVILCACTVFKKLGTFRARGHATGV